MTLIKPLWYFFYLPIVFFAIFCYAGLGSETTAIANEIRLLDRIDNAQTVQTLITHVDNVLNTYLAGQASIKSRKVRAIIWNKPLTDEKLQKYFSKSFDVIKYDETYQDFEDKNFDYTRQTATLADGIWEKFIFIRVKDEIITLFLSYHISPNTALVGSSKIDEFLTLVLTRMFNKIFNPHKSVFNHGMLLIADDKTVIYNFVYHDNHEGFVERRVPSFEDGLREQMQTDEHELSSCILIIKKGERSLHSIRHPIAPGYIVPDFYAHYSILSEQNHSTIHDGL